MDKITQSLALDLVEIQHNVVNARQNDRLTRDLYIKITDKGIGYDKLPETAFAYLRGRRTDGKPIFYNAEIKDRQKGLLHVQLHNYVLCCPGRCKLDIGIYNRVQDENAIQNGKKMPNSVDEIVSTDSFILYIPDEVFDEIGVVESDEGSTLAQLINSARDEIDEMNGLEERVTKNETQRESNEDTREKQENKRAEDTRTAIENTEAAAQSASTAAQNANDAATTANSAATNANNKATDLQNKLDSHYFALMEDLQSHSSSSTAHSDIRGLISDLTTRLNALADSDDTTLDQLSEIVAYIKANRSLIDSITTSKINVADIIDNLTSTATNKPLSAKQGKVLNDLITALTSTVNDKVDKVTGKGLSTNDYTTADKNKLAGIANGAKANVQSDWNVTDSTSDAFIKNKPTIPSKLSQLTNDTGFKTSDTVYTHPTSSGNKHIPSGGSSGQILRWSADGTATWGADNNRGIQDNLTSTSTNDSLTANQGRVLNGKIEDLKKSVSDGKSAVASAITEMGVSTASDAAYSTMSTNIKAIVPTITGSWNGTTYTATAKINGKNTKTVSSDISTPTSDGTYSLDQLLPKDARGYSRGIGYDGYLSTTYVGFPQKVCIARDTPSTNSVFLFKQNKSYKNITNKSTFTTSDVYSSLANQQAAINQMVNIDSEYYILNACNSYLFFYSPQWVVGNVHACGYFFFRPYSASGSTCVMDTSMISPILVKGNGAQRYFRIKTGIFGYICWSAVTGLVIIKAPSTTPWMMHDFFLQVI